jgi:hypothetical protein
MWMTIENPKYDVAISFLSKDEAIAAALHQKLSSGLQVFFYPRNEEDLAGTDGLESMRKIFFDNCRVMVVLYREPWGKTPWTRVEETAIKESCLEHGWQRLFFVVLDRANSIPVWVPQNHVRLNYQDFGLEQAVGAIKARVQDNGGQLLPLTAMKRAETFKAEELFRQAKLRMNSAEGIESILSSVAELFQHIKNRCVGINARGFLQIRCEAVFKEHNAIQSCYMTDGHVGLAVIWTQPYSNVLDQSSLRISEYKGNLTLPSEMGQNIYLHKPQKLDDVEYLPELSLAREQGWRQDNATEFLSCAALAEECVIRFVNLASRYASGELEDSVLD